MKNSLFYYKDLYLWRIHKSNTYLIMKKIIFLAFLAFTSASFQAQENKVKMDTKSSDFNKLTIEIIHLKYRNWRLTNCIYPTILSVCRSFHLILF